MVHAKEQADVKLMVETCHICSDSGAALKYVCMTSGFSHYSFDS